MASTEEIPVPARTRTPIEPLAQEDSHLNTTQNQRPRDNNDGISILQYHPDLAKAYGQNPCHTLLISTGEGSKAAFFHGACEYIEQKDELYITSNLLQPGSSSQIPVIVISQVKLRRKSGSRDEPIEAFTWGKLRPPPNMQMPAGACLYREGVVYCSQGTPEKGATGGLYYMPLGKRPEPLVTSYYGTPFNSVQDVAVAADGVLWFTDNPHGFDQEFRRAPSLPSHIYRFDPKTGDLRVVCNELERPGGVAISRDGKTMYVVDMGTQVAPSEGEASARRTAIYAFDVQERSGSQFLMNKRLLMYPRRGPILRILCDETGNVLAGCGDGVEVWTSGGVLLGVIQVPGGASALWMDDKAMFICAEQNLWLFEFDGDSKTTEAEKESSRLLA